MNEIPYRPIFEAMILEVLIEIIREASIRLPTPIGQTIGIVGGLVIGDAIVKAGLVSNLMVVVVAMTAISSYVVPSLEMNTTIRTEISIYGCRNDFWFFWHGNHDTPPFYSSFKCVIVETALFISTDSF